MCNNVTETPVRTVTKTQPDNNSEQIHITGPTDSLFTTYDQHDNSLFIHVQTFTSTSTIAFDQGEYHHTLELRNKAWIF
jgi:hypothetical protein